MDGKKIKFTVTKDEFLLYMKNYVFASKQMTKTSVKGIVLFFVISIIMLLREGFDASYAGMLTLSVAGMLVGIYFYYIVPARAAAKLGESRDYCYIFSDDDIIIQDGIEEKSAKWDSYPEAVEADNCFYIMDFKRNPIAIPKRAFASTEDIEEFACLVKGHVIKYRKGQ